MRVVVARAGGPPEDYAPLAAAGCEVTFIRAWGDPVHRVLADETVAALAGGAVARGELVDTDALVAAVRSGHLAGVALDVFEDEPLPAAGPLRALDPDRVILTPHTRSNSLESRVGNLRASTENLLAIARGEAPPTTVNPEVLPHWRGRAGR